MEVREKNVMPGDILAKLDNNTAGEGTYVKNGDIYASIRGIAKDEITAAGKNILRVVPKTSQKPNISLKIGQEILGRVLRIKEDMAFVQIIGIEGVAYKLPLEGVIRKQNIREMKVDEIKMEEMFIPGDIVKARVISYGDIKKIYLSTTENHLGVILAKSRETKSLMIPFSWTNMVCPTSGQKELRSYYYVYVKALPDKIWRGMDNSYIALLQK